MFRMLRTPVSDNVTGTGRRYNAMLPATPPYTYTPARLFHNELTPATSPSDLSIHILVNCTPASQHRTPMSGKVVGTPRRYHAVLPETPPSDPAPIPRTPMSGNVAGIARRYHAMLPATPPYTPALRMSSGRRQRIRKAQERASGVGNGSERQSRFGYIGDSTVYTGLLLNVEELSREYAY